MGKARRLTTRRLDSLSERIHALDGHTAAALRAQRDVLAEQDARAHAHIDRLEGMTIERMTRLSAELERMAARMVALEALLDAHQDAPDGVGHPPRC